MSNFSIAYNFKAMTSHFQKNVHAMQRDMKNFEKTFQKNNHSALKFAKNLDKIGSSMTRKLTLPLIAMGTAGIYSFAKLESGLTNTLNLLSKDEISQWGGQLKDAQAKAIEMGFSIEDVNKGLFDNVSALGINNNAMASYKEAQKLAIAGNTTLSASINGITSIVNAYGRETTNSIEVSNALFSAQVKGKVTVEELANNIGKIAPIAKAAGIGFKDALAGLSAMTLGGLSAEESSTALRATLQALLKPTKETAKLLKGWGVPVGQSELAAAGLSKTLKALNNAMEIGGDKFSEAIPNLRAFIGAATLSDDKLKILDDTVIKMGNDIKNGTGLQEGYNRMLATASQELKQLKGKFTIILAQLGTELFPIIKKVIDRGLLPMIKLFKSLSSGTKEWIVKLGLLLTVGGPLLILFSKVITSIIGIGKVLGIVKVAMMGLTGNTIAAAGSMGVLSKAGFLVGAALGGWTIGKLIAQIPVVDKALTKFSNYLMGDEFLQKQGALSDTKLAIANFIKQKNKEQGLNIRIADVINPIQDLKQAKYIKKQLETGQIKLQSLITPLNNIKQLETQSINKQSLITPLNNIKQLEAQPINKQSLITPLNNIKQLEAQSINKQSLIKPLNNIKQLETFNNQLNTNKLNNQQLAGQTNQQMNAKITIETKDPQGIVKNVTPETSNPWISFTNLGGSMMY